MKSRNEALYNLGQENEVFVFFEYLPRVAYFVCKNDSLWKGRGAPPVSLYDVLMNLSIKQYFGRSLRRSIGLIKVMKRIVREFNKSKDKKKIKKNIEKAKGELDKYSLKKVSISDPEARALLKKR
ncbi:MAG: hypothetical protein V1740_06320 [Candidatus Woesearchaeota archaeon]